jgi:hypothetical protein
MKILLFSKVKALAEIGEKSQILNHSTPLAIEETDIVKIFPLESEGVPFCWGYPYKNENVKIVNFPHYVFAEVVGFSNPFVPSVCISKAFSGGVASVLGLPISFIINLSGETHFLPIKEPLTNIEILDTSHAVFLQGVYDNQTFVSAFHKAQKQFLSFFGSVEFSESSIKAITNSKTLAGHGVLSQYNISPNGFEFVAKDAVYLDKRPKTVPPFLTHIAFFEAVREKDFLLAKTYLSDALSQKLSPKHLEEYFGIFNSIKVLNQNGKTKVALIHNSQANVFSLSFEGGKIADIMQD